MPKEVFNNSLPNAEINIDVGTVFSYPTHTHSHYEMTLYEPFDGGITVNGEFYAVTVPTVFLLSPSDFHRISVNGTTRSQFKKIGFYEKTLKELKCELPDRPTVLLSADKFPLLLELFNEIVASSDDTEYVSVLISTAMRCVIKHGSWVQPAVSGKRHDLAIRALRYANKNFTSDITLADVAKQFSVSPQYLSSVFTAEVGVGFSAYITDLRLRLAVELLESRDKNITEVCFECGYRNLSHFLRSFKEKFGITPKEYRKNVRLGIDL